MFSVVCIFNSNNNSHYLIHVGRLTLQFVNICVYNIVFERNWRKYDETVLQRLSKLTGNFSFTIGFDIGLQRMPIIDNADIYYRLILDTLV